MKNNVKISQSKLIFRRIDVYVKMRQIKIPLTMVASKQDSKLTIIAGFKNTKINFSSSTLKTMYKDSIKFIEEMNTIYISNKKTFTPNLIGNNYEHQ